MNEPKVIFLQVGDDYDPQTDNFNELDVTWCSDNIDETDIEYCRITAAELVALREAVEALRQERDEAERHRAEYDRRSAARVKSAIVDDARTPAEYWSGRRDEAGHFRDRLNIILAKLDGLK